MAPSRLLLLPTEIQCQIFYQAVGQWSLTLSMTTQQNPISAGVCLPRVASPIPPEHERFNLCINSDLDAYLNYLRAIPQLRGVIVRVLAENYTGMANLLFPAGRGGSALKGWHIPKSLKHIVIPRTHVVTTSGSCNFGDAAVKRLFPNTEFVQHREYSLPVSLARSYAHDHLKTRRDVLRGLHDTEFMWKALLCRRVHEIFDDYPEGLFSDLKVEMNASEKLHHVYVWMWRIADAGDFSDSYLVTQVEFDRNWSPSYLTRPTKEIIPSVDSHYFNIAVEDWREVGYCDIVDDCLEEPPPSPHSEQYLRYVWRACHAQKQV